MRETDEAIESIIGRKPTIFPAAGMGVKTRLVAAAASAARACA